MVVVLVILKTSYLVFDELYMFFGNYHIILLKEKNGTSKNLYIKGWLGSSLCIFLGVVIISNILLWQQYQNTNILQRQLSESERTIETQNTQLMGLVGKISSLQEDLSRVQRLDSKLRVIVNIEKDIEATSIGGSRTEEFSRTYLPLHRQELMVRKLNNFLKQLSEEVRLEEVRQQELLQTLRDKKEALASIPSIWPISGFITSHFGNRPSPFTGRIEYHKGLDISAAIGTPIQASGNGRVILAGCDGAYGNCVVLQHGSGLTSRYAHMSTVDVKVGQNVRRGQIIGYVGSTGRSSGPHLHYEVKVNGMNVDPLRYILD